MPLTTTLPITVSDIYNEFSVPTSTPFSELVRGGAYVPDTPANAGVPTTLPISPADFLGASAAAPLDLQNANAHAIAVSPSDATATLTIKSTGTVTQQLNFGGVSTLHTWLLSGAAAAWEYRATVLSGAVNAGPTGSWVNAGSGDTAWTLQRTSNIVGTDTCSLLIEIRPAGGGAVADSATFSFTAEVDSGS